MTIETESSATDPVLGEEIDVRGLQSRAVRGTTFLVISYGCALSLRMVSSIVLSRIFMPAYFGLIALVTTIIVALNLFSHVGLEDSVIQNPRGDEPDFRNTAWTIQVIRGVGIWLVTIALAWPAARFFNVPMMTWLLPLIGFGCVIAGFTSPSMLVLARHMGVGKQSMLELISQLTQFVVILIWAYFQRSIWALVAGRLASELIRAIISYCILPAVRPKFILDPSAARSMVTFGKWILIGTALTFLAQQSDRLILGKLVSLQMLGIYGIAFSLSDLPRQIILQFCTRVGFPFISRFAEKPRPDFRAVYVKYRWFVLAAGGLMLIAMINLGDIFILHVYDKRYAGAAWMIGIFAVGLWHTLLYSSINPAIFALQKAHYNAVAYLVYCITLFIALPLGFHYFGMVGAVIAVAASDLPVYCVTVYSAISEGVSALRQDAVMTLLFILVLIGALTLRAGFGLGSPFPSLHGVH